MEQSLAGHYTFTSKPKRWKDKSEVDLICKIRDTEGLEWEEVSKRVNAKYGNGRLPSACRERYYRNRRELARMKRVSRKDK